MSFELVSSFKPAGGQPAAIKALIEGAKRFSRQTLLGITGSGKTFVMANLIAGLGRPTLVLAHNKTLAAQLYQELKELFPKNRVEYFISYFDYYQPESYLPTTDTYIEKDSSVNEQITKMRLKATSSLLSRDDVIVVASISCIYGIGDPANFSQLSLPLTVGEKADRESVIHRLVDMQYQRDDTNLEPGRFRVRGDIIDVIPSYDTEIIRIELFGDTIERITELGHLSGEPLSSFKHIRIFPAKQFVVPDEKSKRAMASIKEELQGWAPQLPDLERHRLEKRVSYDLEMIKEMGYCNGIENYSRHFDGRKAGEPPFTLLDYFPKDFLLIIDESHQSIPQSRAMHLGDRTRKKSLIDYGFRLPSAYDNRPLTFEEFERYFNKTIFVSATPAEYELQTSGQVVELIIRPTGLLDPEVSVRPIEGQVKDLIGEIQKTVAAGERVLVTTLTKRMAEDLADFMAKQDVRVRYMHAEIETLERIELLRQLRAGEYDVLVGINLLREGLDLPEVSLVAILDADKEGFLRNERSLIQTIGRAARNEHGRVIMYADIMTDSIRGAIAITRKRREDQIAFNKKHGITPKTIIKTHVPKTREMNSLKHLPKSDLAKHIAELDAQMHIAAERLDFEKAIELRDLLREAKLHA